MKVVGDPEPDLLDMPDAFSDEAWAIILRAPDSIAPDVARVLYAVERAIRTPNASKRLVRKLADATSPATGRMALLEMIESVVRSREKSIFEPELSWFVFAEYGAAIEPHFAKLKIATWVQHVSKCQPGKRLGTKGQGLARTAALLSCAVGAWGDRDLGSATTAFRQVQKDAARKR